MPIRIRNAVGLLAAAALLGCDAERTTVPTMEGSSAVAEGNGLPDNGHARLYKFNLIGVPKDKKPDMTVDAGKRMFVKLEAPSKIYLQEGDDFDILDANATDANGGRFQLPDPDPDGNGETWYGVYIRPVGKPGGSATVTTCATEVVDVNGTGTTEEICSTENVVLTRTKGKSTFTNVTQQLTSLVACFDVNPDPTITDIDCFRYALFRDELQDWFWQYDNHNLKLAQLRFYAID